MMALKKKNIRNQLINESQKVDEKGPISPQNVYDILISYGLFDTCQFRQEDSQEFLLSLLNGLHEELKYKDSSKDESPISEIFRVHSRSILSRLNEEGPPMLACYQMLPLNIEREDIHTVEDAIDKFTMKESMPELGDDVTNTVSLDKLSTVLILHLVRMVNVREPGSELERPQKISKIVRYRSALVIKPGNTGYYSCYLQRENCVNSLLLLLDWLSPEHRDQANTRYQLFASVYHQGISTIEGHYTCDVRDQDGQWHHISDDIVTRVLESEVLSREESHRENAYMLFYIKV
jgi:ubiquitin carboxyl-terminal hydrolase 10